jgi:hypothetical protein
MMQFVGMKARTEPRNVVNQHVPARLLRDLTMEDRAQWHRRLQGAIPDVAYTDPGHGREVIVELKCINMGPSRYDSREATSLRAAVNKREQQLYQDYLAKLRLKDRRLLHTPVDVVGRGGRPLGARIHKRRQSRGLPGMGTRVLQRAIGWAGQAACDAR